MCAAVRFSTTLEILGLFPYLFDPRCLGFDFGYLVRIERLSGKRRGKPAGGFSRSREKWCEAEVHRATGEVALKSPAPNREKGRSIF
jgi:hypothetical protein